MAKYFRLINRYKGHHYFEERGENKLVTKITFGVSKKKGRAFCPGVTLIKYDTYLSAYKWYIDSINEDRSPVFTEITKEEYDKAFDLIQKRLRNG